MIEKQNIIRLSELILLASKKNLLRKAVLSKPVDKSIVRAVLTQKSISSRPALQLELFHKDNKATHKNLFLDELSADKLCELASSFMQINLLCVGGECEYKCSASGKSIIINEKKLEALLRESSDGDAPDTENNRQKNHILSGNEPFLKLLGVSDQNGRVYDKKQAKFRQINRFLEIIRDTEDKLPKKQIRICDLCCGKSYLSFAAYHYFSVVRGMSVSMTGVDLKPDVIEHCTQVAKELGFEGLEFICGDINNYIPKDLPQLVISLHACDFATDLVLQKAAEWNTDVILSTPCCHHELNHSINCEALDFIAKHSMLRQKLCDAATDALRLCRLEAQGYTTSTIELIDPNETPKNIMLRAIRLKHFDKSSPEAEAKLRRYMTAKAFLLGDNEGADLHF